MKPLLHAGDVDVRRADTGGLVEGEERKAALLAWRDGRATAPYTFWWVDPARGAVRLEDHRLVDLSGVVAT